MMVVSPRSRMVAISIFIIFFSLGYGLLGYTSHSNSLDWTTAIDDVLPFIPNFIVFYLIGDIFIFVAFFVVDDKKKFMKMFVGFLLICSIAYISFMALPVKMEREISYGMDWFSKITSMQHTYDTVYNNFPSLHVAFATYTWLILFYVKRRLSYWLAPVAAGIIISVLFVKQHLFVDVIGGLLLGWIVFLWWRHSERVPAEKHVVKVLRI